MKKEKIINIPNFLSFYRLLSFPFLLWLIYSGNESLFATILCINLVTDILDGLIARTYKLQTEFGAKLDSLADNGTYISAVLGIYTFKQDVLREYMWIIWLFVILYLIGTVYSLFKFKQHTSLHLYSSKITGYLQGIFFFVLFLGSFQKYLFFFAMFVGCISRIELILVLQLLPKMIPDAKGLYWLLKSRMGNPS
ncbi:MAG: CDP-alcohol phosphatidyltransferase family protein [Leadbetterella sp.]